MSFTTITPTVTVTIGKFDKSHHEPDLRILRGASPIARHVPLGLADYSPRGGTPLRDATAQFISHLDGLVAADAVTVGVLADESGSMGGNEASVVEGINSFVEGMRDVDKVDPATAGKALVVILTDGLENASTETTPESLRAMIAEREGRGWTFIYMGANQDAWAEGSKLGYSGGVSGQSVNFVASPKGTASALRAVAGDAAGYLADNDAFVARRSQTSQRSVSEDGQEHAKGSEHEPEHRPASPYADAGDALKRARRR